MTGTVSSAAAALHAGRRVQGTFLKLPAVEVVEVAAAGLDFAVVDLEHSQLSEADALRLVHHAWALDFPALVRIHELDRAFVNRALEAGAAGIQLSSVRSAAEVRALRDASLYAPQGSRSVSLAHARAGYGTQPLREYIDRSEQPLLVIQVETATTDDALEEIASAGADVVFVGVTDLTVDLEFESGSVAARIDEIAAAAAGAGVTLGGFGTDERFMFSIASSDLALLAQAYAHG